MRMVSRRICVRIAAVVVLLLVPVVAVFAQEAVLLGTVVDTTGGVLPGVTITATHTATGNTFVAVTDEKGGYRIPVRVGLFKVDAELPGFGTVTRQIELLIGQTAVLNLQMAPSTVQESVTVTGEAPLVDTTNSSLAANVDPRQMQELPVNGRNWMDLTLLAPGSRANAVAETPISSTSSNITFQLNLDGQQVTNQVALSFGQPRFSRDAIGEFEFVSNRFDASQGRSSGIQVNAITKSGTNTPAGTFSGYFRDDKFNAKDPVTHTVLPYQDQQVSTTFGGPIVKDRIHYFLSYEYEREPQTYVYDTPYPKFNGTLTGARRQDTEMGRFDFQFSPKMRLSIRGNRYDNRIPYDSRYTGGSDRTPASAIGTNRRSEQEYGTFTQVLGARMVNEVRGGHSLFHWNQFAHVKNAGSLIGQTQGFGAPVINLRGFTLGQTHAITPQNIREEDWDIQDNLTMSYNAKGRHDLKAGGEYMHDFTWETTCQTCMGQFTSNNGTLSPQVIQDMIRDVNDVTTWNLAPLSPVTTIYLRNVAMTSSPYSRPAGNNGFTEYAPRHVVAWWAQDDWHASNKLTLNLGVRYDANIDEFVNWVSFPPFIDAGRPQDLNNLAPRLGFNYALTDKTVIRGGYGIYYGTATGQPPLFTLRYVQQIAMTVNYDGRADFAVNPFNGPAPNYDQAKALLCAYQPNPASPTCNLRHSTSNFAAPDIVDPYSHQASLGFQHQIGTQMSVEADWVYTGDRNALTTRNINVAYNPATGAPYPFAGGQAAANYINRPFPGWGSIVSNRSDDAFNYHALQTSFTKRMADHWQASATYTLSRSWQLDQLPLNPGCNYPMTIQPGRGAVCDVPITLAPDVSENAWYVSGAQRNRATFNGIWEAPKGFQLSGLYIFGDNGYSTPTSGFDARSQGSTGGRLRQNGTLIPRNSFNQPPLHRVDMRLQRRFALGSRVKVDGIFEMFNVFNRANFESFTLNESNAKFGQPLASTTLAYQPRMLQFGFRTQF
jgi:carboxypeptidase family protein/TonB-dependent receptor-like protein